jgi:hypothetical protein
MNLQVMGGLHERLRALGIFRPIRLMDKLLESDCDFEVWLRADPIVAIKPLGPVELLSIETSTGTFFAEGFAAAGCPPATTIELGVGRSMRQAVQKPVSS